MMKIAQLFVVFMMIAMVYAETCEMCSCAGEMNPNFTDDSDKCMKKSESALYETCSKEYEACAMRNAEELGEAVGDLGVAVGTGIAFIIGVYVVLPIFICIIICIIICCVVKYTVKAGSKAAAAEGVKEGGDVEMN